MHAVGAKVPDADDKQQHTLGSVLGRIKEGERASDDPELARKLDAAFGKYEGWLRQRCAAELRGFGHQEVEEAVSETLFIAWRRLPEYRGEGRFRTWLKGIARNVCLGMRRKHRDALTEDGVIDARSEDEDDIALTHLLREERENLVRDAAEAVLDGHEQEVVEWRYLHEYSAEQIAELAGFENKDQVRVTLQRCRNRLRKEIQRRLALLGHGRSMLT